jgi:hypothetical protein
MFDGWQTESRCLGHGKVQHLSRHQLLPAAKFGMAKTKPVKPIIKVLFQRDDCASQGV